MGLLAVISILVLVLQITFVIKSLKSEKEGFLSIADAAQELNNRTLHDGAKKLYISNQLKYWMIYISLVQFVISLVLMVNTLS